MLLISHELLILARHRLPLARELSSIDNLELTKVSVATGAAGGLNSTLGPSLEFRLELVA